MAEEVRRSKVFPEFARTTLLVYLLIVSIGITFAAILVAFAFRFIIFGSSPVTLQEFPHELWWGTGCLLVGSHLIHRAYSLVRHEKQIPFRTFLVVAFIIATAFCIIQGIGVLKLLDMHWQQPLNERGSIATIMLLVFLHMAHFIAGVIALGFVVVKAFLGRYDHEYAHGVRLAAFYWRFLDVVWLTMLFFFWLAS